MNVQCVISEWHWYCPSIQWPRICSLTGHCKGRFLKLASYRFCVFPGKGILQRPSHYSVTRLINYFSIFSHLGILMKKCTLVKNCQSRIKILPKITKDVFFRQIWSRCLQHIVRTSCNHCTQRNGNKWKTTFDSKSGSRGWSLAGGVV